MNRWRAHKQRAGTVVIDDGPLLPVVQSSDDGDALTVMPWTIDDGPHSFNDCPIVCPVVPATFRMTAVPKCPNTSALTAKCPTRHQCRNVFMPKCPGAEVSEHFGTDGEVSNSASVPKCLHAKVSRCRSVRKAVDGTKKGADCCNCKGKLQQYINTVWTTKSKLAKLTDLFITYGRRHVYLRIIHFN